jgi:hypothetical protein
MKGLCFPFLRVFCWNHGLELGIRNQVTLGCETNQPKLGSETSEATENGMMDLIQPNITQHIHHCHFFHGKTRGKAPIL